MSPIVTQAGDYARLHTSARPFQLFSIGLLIFGSKFCVAIFDRDGVQFSPIRDMWLNLDVFIRVIRRLSCDLSTVNLGQDPTVEMVPEEQAKQRGGVARVTTPHHQPYPTYRITMGRGDRMWYTLGPPIWTSLSLLGRGTAVWRVCDGSNPGMQLVLKNAWRSSDRLPESIIYRSIKGKHPGVANYQFGDDVVFPRSPNLLMSARNLREDGGGDVPTMVLHRLVVASSGRPLWEYASELELLKGIRAALTGECSQASVAVDGPPFQAIDF